MKWDDIRIFLEVLRAQSLSNAATKLEMNASTVSRRLDSLEASLGVVLFDRSNRGVWPTRFASQLRSAAEAIEAGALNFMTTMESLETNIRGDVKISMPPGLADSFGPQLVRQVRLAHPALTLHIDASIQYVDLARGQADFALRTVKPRSGDLTIRRVGTYRMCVVTTSEPSGPASELNAWTDVSWVNYDDALGHLPSVAWVNERAASAVVMRSNSHSLLLNAVRDGVGVMLAAKPFATLNGLSERRLSDALQSQLNSIPEESLWLAMHRSASRVPRVQAVADVVCELLG